MRTPAQIEAARRNGSRSRGPITPEGKARASQNGTKHGLAGSKCIVLEGELVEEIAATRWRIRRSRTVETAMINMQIEKQRKEIEGEYRQPDYTIRHASAIQGLGANFNLVDRYDTRMRRNFDRAVKNFYDLRARSAQAAEENEFLPTEPEPGGNFSPESL